MSAIQTFYWIVSQKILENTPHPPCYHYLHDCAVLLISFLGKETLKDNKCVCLYILCSTGCDVASLAVLHVIFGWGGVIPWCWPSLFVVLNIRYGCIRPEIVVESCVFLCVVCHQSAIFTLFLGNIPVLLVLALALSCIGHMNQSFSWPLPQTSTLCSLNALYKANFTHLSEDQQRAII